MAIVFLIDHSFRGSTFFFFHERVKCGAKKGCGWMRAVLMQNFLVNLGSSTIRCHALQDALECTPFRMSVCCNSIALHILVHISSSQLPELFRYSATEIALFYPGFYKQQPDYCKTELSDK